MNKRKASLLLAVVFAITIAGVFFVYPAPWSASISSWSPWKLGLDLVGGSHLTYKIDTSAIEQAQISDTLAGLRDVIEKRVNTFGVKEPQIAISQSAGEQFLMVDLAGISDVNEAIQQIGQTPFLDFRTVGALDASGTPAWIPTELKGQYIKSASLSFGQQTSQPQVQLQFTTEGGDIFAQLTEQNVGKQIGIFVDNVLISAPVVNEKIPSGSAVINGQFTIDEAKSLAQNINAGALPAPITLVNQQTVGASLGTHSLNASLFAGLIGTIIIMLFMISYYHQRGFLACIALLVYIVLSLIIFKLFVTMSLAGIAGFLLSIGMAVDANILIFERTKEEMKKGLEKTAAIREGFHRAWSAIRDSNVSTIITTLILFNLTSGFVKGLALTLLLGVLVSMFTAITVTRALMIIFPGKSIIQNKNKI
ncbi:MAG: protein translocase subunit SecD [Candidatus Paceibacterota bacterium]